MTSTSVVSRLAPSPTGHLHLGHALSFLATFWQCRSLGGRLILRLEDLDSDRAHHEYQRSVTEDLQWLGISWDGEPVLQSERLAPIRDAATRLLEADHAYPCVCTRKQILSARRAHDRDLNAPQLGDSPEQPYPGTCRGRFQSLNDAESSGTPAGLRFVTPGEDVKFEDQIFGQHQVSPASQVGDFTLLRRDKTPAYQLAVVVDDDMDQVTDVVRGRDLLDSTARQIQVARALGITPPRYAHTPLVCDHSGRRLAKRHNALSLKTLRDHGVHPSSIVQFAARCLGQPPELSMDRATFSSFSVANIAVDDILLPQSLEEVVESLKRSP